MTGLLKLTVPGEPPPVIAAFGALIVKFGIFAAPGDMVTVRAAVPLITSGILPPSQVEAILSVPSASNVADAPPLFWTIPSVRVSAPVVINVLVVLK